ncbi:MAG: triose-phosphate isomerase [bacterium]
MERRPIMAGNWKMNLLVGEAESLVKGLLAALKDTADVDVLVAPAFTSLYPVARLLAGTSIGLAAQNLYWEEFGAFTGEVNAKMLRDVGCSHVIIGHSERRQFFGETNETANRRLKTALSGGLVPILCIGETLEERKQGKTLALVQEQLEKGLAGIGPEEARRIVLAYEPVWAIGTGETATPEQAEEVHAHIRKLVGARFGEAVAAGTRIQYGGSVKPDNVQSLMEQPDIDGALVGGASLKAESFARIVRYKA